AGNTQEPFWMNLQDMIRTSAGLPVLVLCLCGIVEAQSGDAGAPAPRASRVVGRPGPPAAYAPDDGQAVRQAQATTGDAPTPSTSPGSEAAVESTNTDLSLP